MQAEDNEVINDKSITYSSKISPVKESHRSPQKPDHYTHIPTMQEELEATKNEAMKEEISETEKMEAIRLLEQEESAIVAASSDHANPEGKIIKKRKRAGTKTEDIKKPKVAEKKKPKRAKKKADKSSKSKEPKKKAPAKKKKPVEKKKPAKKDMHDFFANFKIKGSKALKVKGLSEEEKRIVEFNKQHPKYVKEGKIVYPIEDSLFEQYPFLASKNPIKPIVPADDHEINPFLLGNILRIYSFFARFDELIHGPEFSKEELYTSINYQSPAYLDLIHDIHIALLTLFIDEFNEKKKFENPRDDGMVFYLLSYLKEDFRETHIRLFWPELLVGIGQMNEYQYILDDETKGIFQEIAEVGVKGYNFIDPFKKLKAICMLIEVIHELHCFKDNVSGLFDGQNELSKEKAKVEKDLAKEEKLLADEQAKLEDIESKIKEEESKISMHSRQQNHQIRSDIERLKKRSNMLHSNVVKTEHACERLREQIEQLEVKIPFVIHPTMFLGKDRNRNSYFFFSDDPYGVYVMRHQTDLTIPQDWGWIGTEAKVVELKDTLIQDGIRESELFSNISSILPYINFGGQEKESPQKTIIDANTASILEYESMYQPKQRSRKPQTRRTDTTFKTLHTFREKFYMATPEERSTVKFLLEILLSLEEEFTNHLHSRQCRWIEPEQRQELLKDLQEKINENRILECLVNFNGRFSYIQQLTEEEDDGHQSPPSIDEDDEIQVPRKRQNKMWRQEETHEDAAVQESEDNENQFSPENANTLDNEFGFKSYSIKKIILKIWGLYNDGFKTSWENYAKNAKNFGAIYFATAIFVDIICKYISRKKAKFEQDKEEEKKRLRKNKREKWRDMGMDQERAEAVEKFNLRIRERVRRKSSDYSYGSSESPKNRRRRLVLNKGTDRRPLTRRYYE